MRQRGAAVILAWALAACPAPAWAGETDPKNTPTVTNKQSASGQSVPTLAQARAAFLEGRRLMKEEDWGKAGDQFARALRGKETPGLYYHLGLCREKEGRLVDALTSYHSAEELLKIAPSGDVQGILTPAMDRVEKNLSSVIFQGVPAGVLLTVDGLPQLLGERILIDPGAHEVKISGEGWQDFSLPLFALAGKTKVVIVAMQPLVSRPLSNTITPHPASKGNDSGQDNLRTGVLWGGVGVAAAGSVVGITGLVLMLDAQGEMNNIQDILQNTGLLTNSSCYQPQEDFVEPCDALQSAYNRKQGGRALVIGGSISFGIGALSALATHYFWPQSTVQLEFVAQKTTKRFSLRGRF